MSDMLIDTSCYIHEIPFSIYRLLCGQLDQNNRWQSLARNIGYENTIIEQIKLSTSPATKLLSLWSDQNHTVAELFMALYRIREFQIMEYLRELVDRAFHRLICTSSMNSSISSSTKSQSMEKRIKKSTRDMNKNKINPFDTILSGIPPIAFAELTAATNHWSNEKILGAGSYGTVFSGKWKYTEVAIKRIDCRGLDKNETTKKQLRQIMVEMRFLNTHRHDNILPLYGYSFDGSSTCLVYQMMASGSLEHRLHVNKFRLTYKQRLNIAIGTARGLQFLHTFNKKPTVHGDIKSANILLDGNLQPRIGDFGFARHTNGTTKAKYIYGSRGYIADDFVKTLIISTKNDTYSFGVVLFELATGLKSIDKCRGSLQLLAKYMWAFSKIRSQHSDLIDANEKRSKRAIPVLQQFIKIGYACTNQLAIERPEMSDVLDSLLKINY